MMTDTPLLEWREHLPPHADKLQAGWLECKARNPQLLNQCYQLCLTAQRRGITRWSADAMFHVLRWETAASMNDNGLKVNNNYSSLAARDLMAEHPELQGFFELRARKPRGNRGQIH
jgi:hypothetical protein